MLQKIFYLIISIAFLFACTSNTETKETASTPNEKTPNYDNQIDTLATRYLDLGRFSGTILIAQDDSIVFNKSYGLADYITIKEFTDSTAFKIGHLSEIFTEAIIRDLISQNLIQLDEKVSTYIPQIKQNFTIEQLLNHQTKLQTIAQIQEENPNKPYSLLEYISLSNNKDDKIIENQSELDYNILGIIIEKITTKSFSEVLENYAQKWNLENTYFHKTDTTHLAIGYLFFNHRNQGLKLKPSPKYQDSMAFSSRGIKSTTQDIFKFTQQLSDKNINKEGFLINDGFSYSIKKDNDKKQTVLILSNRKHPIAREMSESIDKILNDKEYELPLLRQEIAINPSLLKEYEGTYSMNEDTKLTFVAEKDSLFFIMGENKIKLKPQSENQFFMFENDSSIRFERDSTDKISKAILLDGFLEGKTALKIEE
ncbi:penicillin-binding protein, beta-lactamase class C [Bernardetia litoralis DSM 6794]|uniref:Penicillin-binding protein, beta-lactamase class C n=1 Tax=Bernardetia litoralis (strain ATCC 23117 / DSM 6794 / NBRC 15988 / NCIMB 1366 / Fx l1 / Sio-4) TaxID=880071 RepID=I4AHC0_BERLS|nr:serine hydrolase [Bernardetia litoralis]AFM03355.1 penicillin-binding protein, beta-lactamase class C [Bernardetia litoralis DSM 6794]